jgi:hypothetical protein
MGVEKQDMASPDMSETLDVADAQAEAPAESSTVENGETEQDFLSVARSVVEEGAEAEGDEPDADDLDAGAPGAAASQADDEGDGKEQDSEPDDENFSDAPFHNHPRFKKLIAQRNEYRAGHEQFQKVQNYLVENGLSGEEAADGFEIMALLKRDPVKAWERLKPIVQNLLVVTGSVLPDDLKARVQRGELTRDAAMEMSRLRAGQQTMTQQQEFERQRAEQMAQMQAINTVKAEVGSWEMAQRAKDPDFDAKYDVIEGQVLRLQRTEGMPRTPAEAKAQLDRAYQAANTLFASQKPRRPERKPVTGGRVAGTPRAEPQSMEDVVRRALEASRG